MKIHSNILIISGDGRKCGKTTLACRLISVFAGQGVIAIKICPHIHEVKDMEVIHEVPGSYGIYRETSVDTGKDSSLMLEAGATLVLYVQCEGPAIIDVWEQIKELVPDDRPVICESGGLAGIIKPGLLVVMRGSEQRKHVSENYDVSLTLTEIEQAVSKFAFSKGKWQYKR